MLRRTVGDPTRKVDVMPIWILCFLIITCGLVFGYWHQIKSWFRGGEPQIAVNPSFRGMARHSIAYVEVHAGPAWVRRPVPAYDTFWRIPKLMLNGRVWA